MRHTSSLDDKARYGVRELVYKSRIAFHHASLSKEQKTTTARTPLSNPLIHKAHLTHTKFPNQALPFLPSSQNTAEKPPLPVRSLLSPSSSPFLLFVPHRQTNPPHNDNIRDVHRHCHHHYHRHRITGKISQRDPAAMVPISQRSARRPRASETHAGRSARRGRQSADENGRPGATGRGCWC